MHKIILKFSITIRACLALCFLCCLTFNSFGQNSKTLSGDTAFWLKFQNETCDKLKLQPLISSNDNYHFRFWTEGQVIDLWSLDGESYNGSVVSYIYSFIYSDKKKTNKPAQLFSKQTYLDTAVARKAFKLTQHIAKIPSDKYIKAWTQGFDGIEYMFETSSPNTYNIRTYWTPTAQDSSLVEAKVIQGFVNNLDTSLSLRYKYNQFFSTLKPGRYTKGSMIITKLTQKQSESSKKSKPYRDYLDSVSDSLNHYLSDTLTKILKKYGELKCYDEFQLTFSKDNKLIEVKTNDELTDRDDRRQYGDCKRKIQQAFKLITIDFVHSKVGYQRRLDYYEGKINVYD